MSSHDGGRSLRQSKRYSVTALYLSMSAKEKDMEIDDELAKGMVTTTHLKGMSLHCGSSESTAGS